MNLTLWLLAQPVIALILVAYQLLYSRTAARTQAATTVAGIKRWAEISGAMLGGVFAADLALLVVLAVLTGGPIAWLASVPAVSALGWLGWWVVPSHRTVATSAEIVINGRPEAVSAFLADLGGSARWEPDAISSVPGPLTPAGPVFHMVARMPGSGKLIEGDEVLTENRPGQAVTAKVVGGGSSGDYFTLAPDGDATRVKLVDKVELPLLLALIGGRFAADATYVTDATRRRQNELARAKAAFEGTPLPEPPLPTAEAPASTPAPANQKFQAVLMIVVGVLGVAAGVLSVLLSLQQDAQVKAYDAATECASALDALGGDSCIYSGSATVTGSSRQRRLMVDITFSSLPGRRFTAGFATDREPPASVTATESAVTAELWNGRVTRFASVATDRNPDYGPKNGWIAGLIILLVGLGATAWGAWSARAAWRPD